MLALLLDYCMSLHLVLFFDFGDLWSVHARSDF